MRTVLFLTHGAQMGGGERVLLDLVQRLDRLRIRPLLATFEDGELIARARDLGVETFVIGAAVNLARLSRRTSTVLDLARSAVAFAAAVRWVASRARRARVDVVVTNSLKGGHVHGAIGGRLGGARVVARVHDIAATPPFSPVTLRVLSLGLRLADRVLPVSRAAARALRDLGVPESKLRVIHNGVELETALAPEARGRIRAELELPEDAVVLASLGRLTRWKGQHLLLEALPELARRFPAVRVLIAGAPFYDSDEYEREIRSRALDPQLEGRARVLGYRTDVPDLLRASDVLVHTSTEPDPLPTVLLEAIACGTFVVAARAGGVEEIVTGDGVGRLYAPGDADALVATLSSVLAERTYRAFDEAEARRIVERFSMRRYVEEMTSELLAT